MKTNTTQKIAAVLVPAALLFSLSVPAFAEDSIQLNAGATISTGIRTKTKDAAVTRASTEIKNREDDLNALLGRIQGMAHVSDSVKASISASLQGTISSLHSLKAKIDDDSDAAELKNDMKSITAGTRVYLLVAPQARILAAADRVGMVTDMVAGLNTKLQTRIAAAQTAGKDVTATVTLEADVAAKLADAKVQAAAAITAASGLTPDNGDAAKLAANNAALKTARTALMNAEKDLKAAQKDMKDCISIVKSFHLDAKASADANATSNQ